MYGLYIHVFSGDLDANLDGIERDAATWILTITLSVRCSNQLHCVCSDWALYVSFLPAIQDPCESQVIDNAAINICSVAGGQQCYKFLAPKEAIEESMNGQLSISFSVHVLDDMDYTSTVCVLYESRQEICSMNSFPISMCDDEIFPWYCIKYCFGVVYMQVHLTYL